MTSLADWAARFTAAAANPPKLSVTSMKTRQKPLMSPRDSRGRPRALVRQSLATESAANAQARSSAIQAAKDDARAQGKAKLA